MNVANVCLFTELQRSKLFQSKPYFLQADAGLKLVDFQRQVKPGPD